MDAMTAVILIGVILVVLVISAAILIYSQTKAEENVRAAVEKVAQLNKEQKLAVQNLKTHFETLTPPSNPERRVEVKIAKGRTQSSGNLQMNMNTSRKYRDSEADYDVTPIITSNLINTVVYIDSTPVYDEPTYQAPSRSYDSCSSSDYNRSSSYSSSSSDYSSSSSSDSSSCSSSSSD